MKQAKLVIIAAVAAWLTVFCVRFASDQFAHGIDLDRYALPASIETFAENSHYPFRGVSTYIREFQGKLGHCSCPATRLDAALLAFPPALMTLLAVRRLIRSRGSWENWIHLALVLGLVQVVLWPPYWRTSALDVTRGFFRLADVREWDDAMRVPAVLQQVFFAWSWPGWLLLLLFPGRRIAGLLSIPYFGFAALQAALAVAWSEDFRPFVTLYRAVANHPTELLRWDLPSHVWFS